MIQLKVYPNTDRAQSQQVFVDLYDTEPIKLTLSIEDITDADATSVFSRTFKIPATRHNNTFFTNAFEIDGVDYDVTIKKPAEILVDGQEFRQGHIRLQKIYVNGDLDKTDYELLFLGETRDFSSLIGDKPLCQLVMPDVLVTDSAGEPRNPTKQDLINSWQAFPEGTSVDSEGRPNSGLNDGNLLFPLIDHGNVYDDQGTVLEPDIRVGTVSELAFTHSQNPIGVNRMKPMIRAKRIWDQIFADAGYTYTSEFINSTLFHQMYVSAFGNEPNIGYSVTQSSLNIFQAENLTSGCNEDGTQYTGQGAGGPFLWLNDNIYDPGNNYTVGVNGGGSFYTTPAAAVAGDATAKYRITARAYVFAEREISCPGFCTNPVAVRLELFSMQSGQVLAHSNWGYDQIVSLTFDSELDNIGVSASDILFLRAVAQTSPDFDCVHSIRWEVQEAPGSLNPVADLDCEYKQIDFIKDVLKMFRLVLAPDPAQSNNFIVEPWQTYINSGDLHDWSHKLVTNKDVVLEPLFNTQSEEIEYRFQEDEDFINKFHFDQFKEPYGYLKFDSNNDLLKGTRSVETIDIAPTPLGTIYEDTSGAHQVPGWILPLIHANESADTGNIRVPIVPKTRFLFYNGLVPIPQSGTSTTQWYLGSVGSPSAFSNYPLVSSFEHWPQTQNGLNLNWANDVSYWNPANTSVFDVDGLTLFDNYWSRYIGSLYGKFSRRLTAYFVLNNVDLQNFSFDDTIFVNGKYYRPEKIIDVNIGERTEVKVQLITANDFTPPAYIDDNLTNFSLLSTNELCGCDGIITVTTDGASPFTWELSNGQTGTAITTGNNPQQFDIEGVCAGTYNVNVIDDLGRSNSGTITVNPSATGIPEATYTVTDATNCQSPCNGQVTVTPSGGQSPYTIQWQDGGTGNRTDLCPGTHPFVVVDANGCESDSYDVVVDCQPVTNPVWEIKRRLADCSGFDGTTEYIEDPVSGLSVGINLSLDDIGGCWEVIQQVVSIQPTVGPWQGFSANCTACQSANHQWQIQECDGSSIRYLSTTEYPNLTVGQSVTISGSVACWKVISGTTFNAGTNETVTQVFDNCETCDNATPNLYRIEGCDGTDPVAPPPTGGTPVIGGFATQEQSRVVAPVVSVFDFSLGPTQNICDIQGVAYRTANSTTEGWYYAQPEFYLRNIVDVPSDTKISLVRGETSDYIIDDVLFTITYSDYATLSAQPSGTYNNFTVNTPASYYLADGQFAGWIIHRDDNEPVVPSNACTVNQPQSGAIAGAKPGSFQLYLDMNWYSVQYPTGNVMSSDGVLNTGDVVTINELDGCYEIVGPANVNSQIDYTYNENGGVYESCVTCTGGTVQQHCHTVSATTTPTVFLYTYDDGSGSGPTSQFITLNAGQSDTICATLNSITIGTGTGTIQDLGTTCFATDWGTSCDPRPPATKYCYQIEGVAGPGTAISEFNWQEDGVLQRAKLKPGETLDICADDGTVQNVFGQGNITGGTSPCISVTDCVTCYKYLFEGGPGLDLSFTACDGVQYYLYDVFRANGGIGLLPYCIASIDGGSAVPFLTQTTPCTIP